jgi:hypothetical protein
VLRVPRSVIVQHVHHLVSVNLTEIARNVKMVIVLRVQRLEIAQLVHHSEIVNRLVIAHVVKMEIVLHAHMLISRLIIAHHVVMTASANLMLANHSVINLALAALVINPVLAALVVNQVVVSVANRAASQKENRHHAEDRLQIPRLNGGFFFTFTQANK